MQGNNRCLSLRVAPAGALLLQPLSEWLQQETVGVGTDEGYADGHRGDWWLELWACCPRDLDNMAGIHTRDLKVKVLGDSDVKRWTLARCCLPQGMRTRKAKALTVKGGQHASDSFCPCVTLMPVLSLCSSLQYRFVYSILSLCLSNLLARI